MSVVRFIHTDFLRLGTPLHGLADAPSWLRQLATGAVRQATRNVIDLAVSRRAQFVLIAGGIVDSGSDLKPAAQWLNEQFETLRSHGIRVVAVSDEPETRAVLQGICDVILRADESLQVSTDGTDLHLNAVPFTQAKHAATDLTVHIGDRPSLSPAQFCYHAGPALQSSLDCSRVSHNGRLSLSAGAVQSISQNDTSECGCIFVEGDIKNRELKSRFHRCDVLQFRTETVTLPHFTSIDSLVSEITRASDAVDQTSSQTVIVDWILQARVRTDLSQIDQLNERQLLAKLRSHLHSGHKGIWPRRISFGRSSTVQLTSPATPVVEEYAELATADVSPAIRQIPSKSPLTEDHQTPATPGLLTGLAFLSRVA